MPETTQLSESKRMLLEKYLKSKQQAVTSSSSGDSIPRHRREDYAPLSFIQEHMWLLAQMITDTPVYNDSVTVRLPGQLDVPALEQSLNAIVARHEIWRTTFPVIDGNPVQQIHPELKLDLSVTDLRHLPLAERESEAIRLATEQAKPFFDLTTLPLLRATLVHLGDEDHRLYMTFHHIILDGTIYKVFLPELYAHYKAFSQGKPSSLPPLPIQYADFAIWQREKLQPDTLTEQLSYWKKQLAQTPATLDLPTDHPRPARQTYDGKRLFFSFSHELTEGIRSLSKHEGVTLYMTLVASFYVLLYRYTGQTDINIGSATSGHNRIELQNLLGVFINTLVLRGDLSGNPTFQELLKQVSNLVLDANMHADIPFTYLIKEVLPERDHTQNPLVQVMLSLQPPIPVLPSGWTVTQSDAEINTAKFDIYLELDDRPDGFDAWLEYNTALWDEETAQRMIKHWRTILTSVVADPSQHIADLRLLDQQELQQVLYDWNATEHEYPRTQVLPQIFEAQAQDEADKIALIFEDHSLTYGELNRRANQLAHYLQRQGLELEGRVALCVESSLDLAVGILGILKAGGAYVPLDPTYPLERLAFMLTDAQAPLLLTQQRLLARLPQHAQAICLDTDWQQVAQESTENLCSAITPTNLAYVIYTSGSTGTPKGVQGTHRATLNRFAWMWDTYPFTEHDVCCQKTSLSFVDAIWELLGPLVKGQRVVIFPDDARKDLGQMVTQLARGYVTRMVLVPSLLRALLDAYEDIQERLPELRFWVSSGEALPIELAKRFHQRLPGCTLLNLYGSSEVAADVTCYDTSLLGDAVTCMPIGKPIANTRVYVLDPHLQPVAPGLAGELYSGGIGVARGYLGRPDLTAEKFIPDPFSSEPSARMYRTGDRARHLPDGSIEYLGRHDNQVKIRGLRIELGEIEAALTHHEAVKSAAVIVREDTPGDQRLVAYVVSQDEITSEALHLHMENSLPSYMVPSVILFLKELPLTPNGKTDRKALPAPDAVNVQHKQEYVAPVLLEHYQLLQIWEDLLDARPIGIRDNFFRLGGHSLLAAHLSLRIEQVFGKKLSLNTLFASPTIEELTQALSQEATSQGQTSVTVIQSGKGKRPFFFMHGDWTGGPFYCFTLAHACGPDQPFYAINTYQFNKPHIPLTLAEMAAAHVKVLREVQPEGPYLLGGFCNGGMIAYEMGRQLQEAGQQLELLLLVAPARTSRAYKITYALSQTLSKALLFKRRRQLNLYLHIRHSARHLYRLMRPGDEMLEDFDKLVAIDSRLNGMFPPLEALYKDYIGVFSWLATPYKFSFDPKKAHFIWAEQEMEIWNEWFDIALHKETSIMPGTHMDCVTKHVDLLSKIMQTSLGKVQAGPDK